MIVEGTTSSVDGMMQGIAQEFYREGELLPVRTTTDPSSPDYGKPMHELSFIWTVTNPRDRLVYCKPIDIYNLVGLWVWMLSGSEEVAPIDFYNPVARRFVDEETNAQRLRASWGARLFGNGSVDKTIRLLRSSPDTRRAIIPVFSPEDVGHESRNLPCLASIQFATRNGKLNAYVTMRSQAAVGVLPYDAFLLTMLQEYVAMRVGIPLGEYTVFMPLCGVRAPEWDTIISMATARIEMEDGAMMDMPPLDPGHLSLFLACERKARAGHFPDESSLLPLYWGDFIELAYTKAKKYNLPPNLAAFPLDFIQNCALREKTNK